jgi:hypothetical protein
MSPVRLSTEVTGASTHFTGAAFCILCVLPFCAVPTFKRPGTNNESIAANTTIRLGDNFEFVICSSEERRPELKENCFLLSIAQNLIGCYHPGKSLAS